jgi:hypothetical protein
MSATFNGVRRMQPAIVRHCAPVLQWIVVNR